MTEEEIAANEVSPEVKQWIEDKTTNRWGGKEVEVKTKFKNSNSNPGPDRTNGVLTGKQI